MLRYIWCLLIFTACASSSDRGPAAVTENAVRFVVYKNQVLSVHSCKDFKKKRLDHLWTNVGSPTYASNRLKSLIEITSDQCEVNKGFEVVLDHTGTIKSDFVERKGLKLPATPLGSEMFSVSNFLLEKQKLTPKFYNNVFISSGRNPTY